MSERANGLLIKLMQSRAGLTMSGVSLGFVLLYLGLSPFATTDITTALASASLLPWLLLAVLVYVGGLLLRGLRLRLLVSQESQLTVLTATNIVAIGYAANNLVPARLGELVRAAMLSNRTGLSFIQSLTIAGAERLLDGVAILLVTGWAWSWMPTNSWMFETWRFAACIITAALVAVVLLSASPQLTIALTSKLAQNFGTVWCNRIIRWISDVLRGLAFCQSFKRTQGVLVVSIAVWLVEATCFMLVQAGVHLPMNFTLAQLTMGFTNLGILLPSGPDTSALTTCSVKRACKQSLVRGGSVSTAVTYAVIMHLIYYAITTIWGVIAGTAYGLRYGRKTLLVWAAAPLNTIPPGHPARVIVTLAPSQEGLIPCNAFWIALCEALVGSKSLPSAKEERSKVSRAITLFVVSQLSNLRPQLRFMLGAGIRTFQLYVALLSWRPFCHLSEQRRTALIESWASGPLPLTRKLFKPIRSLALLAAFEQPEVRALLDALDQQAVLDSGAKSGKTTATNPSSNDKGAMQVQP